MLPTDLATSAEAVRYGGVGGLYGAAAMSIVRLALHRAGFIDKTVPQAVEEWIAPRLGFEQVGGKGAHNLADQLLHLGYGAVLAALAGPILIGRFRRAGLSRGLLFGSATWVIGLLIRPILGIAHRPQRASWRENVTNIVAHILSFA
jgi:hypothetical protein